MTNIESAEGTYGHRSLPARWTGPIAWLFGRPEAPVEVLDGEPDNVPASPPGSVRPRDLRRFTPREMSELSLDLCVAGLLGYEDYAMLAFQPELHPDYDITIGALTGIKAQPDRPRDFVELWEDRLRFERTHSPENRKLIGRIQHIVHLLRRFAALPESMG
jgi:hypothetical protein